MVSHFMKILSFFCRLAPQSRLFLLNELCKQNLSNKENRWILVSRFCLYITRIMTFENYWKNDNSQGSAEIQTFNLVSYHHKTLVLRVILKLMNSSITFIQFVF